MNKVATMMFGPPLLYPYFDSPTQKVLYVMVHIQQQHVLLYKTIVANIQTTRKCIEDV